MKEIELLAQLLRDRQYSITPSIDLAEFLIRNGYSRTKPAELPEVKKECSHHWVGKYLRYCQHCGIGMPYPSNKHDISDSCEKESKADQTVDISDLISLEVTTKLGQDGKQRFLTEESARAILNLLKSKGEN